MMEGCIWRLANTYRECGWLEFESSVPGVDCPLCSNRWARRQYVPTRCSVPPQLKREPSNIPFRFVEAYCEELQRSGLKNPMNRDEGGPYFGFTPGSAFGDVSWQCFPEPREAIEPVVSSVCVLCEVDLSRLKSLRETWFIPITNVDDCYALIANTERVMLPQGIDGLQFSKCSLCRRVEWIKTPEQQQRNGYISSTLKKSRCLPACMIPNRDVFVISYLHQWFITSAMREVIEPFVSKSSVFSFEEWKVVPSWEEILPKLAR